MLAVHFGAGNIGRGFIGSLLSDAGYEVCFIDVNEEVVNLLNERKEYRVVLADEESKETLVKGVRAINSMQHPEDVIKAIAEADLVTTAVGPNVLPIISESITNGLRKRVKLDNPLNIIACENMIGGSVFLKEKVYEKLSDSEGKQFDKLFAFPNAAVDRIVPNQVNDDKLMVSVEPFFEWAVDRSSMIGEVPSIEGVTWVDDLTPYIERKLFTVNTGHAVAAYTGYQAGMKTIKDAMENPEVVDIVKNALQETGSVLVEKYNFNSDEHQQYIEKIIGRFTNPYINDEIPRVARGPLRKLGRNDRLVNPSVQYLEYLQKEPTYLVKGIAAALKYDYPEDEEAVKLQALIEENGMKEAVQEVCGLQEADRLVKLILKELE
ncbi:mannitol-1-phosphate 5-dehydrogenase [Fictibacillus phosphorivorans]|uniref:mannitol-1-phosphate 5-dehydrogenase n=1 Tax=Fictibacillus phosphorivorans TaxID=1221500 RepID=UPI0020419359|nr:mannitol-1-phosphate 5-dehydrogenase [Fictibacillus phosphorivorans]MCM3716932.1 mannitol-1-phosphate 5-dehydrogenase [Fictibacillus phosphorivorans]MCM3774519.1 mannitol-1-phosphate 5-dehydrogenase [Fictibacillus phosphorivorans]